MTGVMWREASLDRFRGCLLGLACGDAVGGPAEFYRRGRFTPLTGMHGGGKFKLAPGEWTDDTAMALCHAESLLAKGQCDPKDQMQRYWRWANEGHWSTRKPAFGMGKTVATALLRFNRSGNPIAGPTAPMTAGNGSIMRLAPVAMFYAGQGEVLLDAAEQSSRTTHGADECLAACRFLAVLLDGCLRGAAKEEALDRSAKLSMPPGMGRIGDQNFRTAVEADIRGTGYVVDCLEAALWCFWNTNNFADAVLKAANLGDDADTTAAVCGQIAGAFYGESSIPSEWLAVLHQRVEIADMAELIWKHAAESM